MKLFKRIMIVLIFCLGLSLFACGKKDTKEPTTDGIPTSEKEVYTLTVINENRECGSVTEFDHQKFEKGWSATIVASPNPGCTFLGWYENGVFLSDQLEFTIVFTIPGDEVIIAKWANESYCSLTTVNSNSNAGIITNYTNESLEKNSTVKLLATPNTGYEFDGWYNGESKISSSINYEFTITSNLTLTAKWNSISTDNVAYLLEHFNCETISGSLTITGVKNENVKEIVVPNEVQRIGGSAFENLTSLEKITFTSNITFCGGEAFTGCNQLDVFYNGTIKQFVSIYLSNGNGNPMCNGGNFYLLDENGNYAQNGNRYTLITDLILTNDITKIGYCCFRTFNNLESILIPSSVTEIGFASFDGCDNLTKVFYEGDSTLFALIDIDDDSYLNLDCIYYYSETQPTTTGKFWHYVDNKPCIWGEEPTITYTLTTTNDNTSAGTCTIYTNKEFEAGSSVSLTATPATGYTFDGWYNGTTKVSSDSNYTFNISSNLTLVAKWMVAPEDKYILSTVNSYSNAGSITNYTNQEFDKNASVTLTVTKNTGYKFDGWYNGSTKVSSDSSYTFTIESNLTLTAKWKIYISAFANTPIGGTYPDFEDNEYDPNESLTLTATTNPETGYTFDGWYEWNYSDECLGRVSENETYTFNVTKPAIYQAYWVAYTVTTKPCYNSGNDVPDSTSYYYIAGDFTTLDEEKVTAGETVTLVAVPKEGSVTWIGWYKQTGNHTDGYTYTLLSNELSYDYTMTKENVTIVAKFLLYKVIATDSSNNPTIIEYGYYPQTQETEDTIIAQLNTKYENLPTAENANGWTDYEYYSSGNVESYMWYLDVDLDNDGFMDYRGVYFIKYRSTSTSGTAYSTGSGETNNNIYINGYRKETVYWFKYEPIIWDVVDDAGAGDKRIVSRYVLDGQNWYIDGADRPDGLDVISPSNYEHSTIRTWLNNDFYYKAFDLYRQKNNTPNATDNSITSTGSTNTNNYLCNDTVDKAYLLSRAEHKAYLDGKTYEKGRPTDYAKIQGLNVGDSGSSSGYVSCWLRTPANSATSVFNASTSGGYSSNPVREVKGIRPAIDMML